MFVLLSSWLIARSILKHFSAIAGITPKKLAIAAILPVEFLKAPDYDQCYVHVITNFAKGENERKWHFCLFFAYETVILI